MSSSVARDRRREYSPDEERRRRRGRYDDDGAVEYRQRDDAGPSSWRDGERRRYERAYHHDGEGERGNYSSRWNGSRPRSRDRYESASRRRDRRESSPSQRRRPRPSSSSASPPATRRRGGVPPSPPPSSRQREPLPPQSTLAAGGDVAEEEAEDTPDFGASGLLAKESNQVNGTALKYHEPPEAKQPKKKWRLYVFKDGEEVDLFHISRQSCYLFGRDRNVVDIPLDHTSCSKQHAVIQYRLNITRNEFGDEKRNVKPYLLDLDSANGSTVNKKAVPPSRYYELRNGDTVRFAASEREYVLLCEDV